MRYKKSQIEDIVMNICRSRYYIDILKVWYNNIVIISYPVLAPFCRKKTKLKLLHWILSNTHYVENVLYSSFIHKCTFYNDSTDYQYHWYKTVSQNLNRKAYNC